ncbi:MAG TPA: isopentenyl phosphate kinase family protein [Thermoflexia bacterium]|nr:isopentenyl phosphate kinase family protein [Thermoflexia bacterium]
MASEDLVFLKLGGSLITDKARPYTHRPDLIRRLGEEIRQALDGRPGLRLLLGHGSGSFGHQAAAPYGTRDGVRTPREWRGFAEVAGAAARLNVLVTDLLLEAGLPVVSLSPRASVRCRDGAIVRLAVEPIQEALRHGLVPLVYGDVAWDEVRGGTIVSTEDLFVYLAPLLRPGRILLAGAAPGVLDDRRNVIPRITPPSFPKVRRFLRGAYTTDVTGGMADKVAQMVRLVERVPGLEVYIFSGRERGRVRQAMEGGSLGFGTCILGAEGRA